MEKNPVTPHLFAHEGCMQKRKSDALSAIQTLLLLVSF